MDTTEQSTPCKSNIPPPSPLSSRRKIRSPSDLEELNVDSSRPPFFAPASEETSSRPSVLCYGENTEDVLRMKRLVLVMAGLPGSGKSYISKKLCRYLRWLGFQARYFNSSDYRKQVIGEAGVQDYAENHEQIWEALTSAAVEDLTRWLLGEHGYVGVLDCTNVTRKQRVWLLEYLGKVADAQVVFIESICKDSDILEMNLGLKLGNTSYRDMDKEQARRELTKRIEWYRTVYEPLSDEEDALSYIQVHDIGKKLIINQCYGYLTSLVASCLNNMHPLPRKIYLSRHGQSEDNRRGVLGGDSPLTEDGRAYAQRLAKYISSSAPPHLLVWTSCLRRTVQTADPLRHTMGVAIHPTPLLNEIAGGMCDNITEKELEENFPEVFKARQADKLAYRYPGGGESYLDLIERVKPLILELERLQVPVLVICHKAVLRVLLAYFTDMPLNEMTVFDVPLHTVFELDTTVYSCNVKQVALKQ